MQNSADLRARAEQCFLWARVARDRFVAAKFAALGRAYMNMAAEFEAGPTVGSAQAPLRPAACAPAMRPNTAPRSTDVAPA
jgi:hypothetical protein